MTDDTSQMKPPTEGTEEADFLEHLSNEFDALTQLRHEVGAEEYGDVAFLTAPLVRMAAEELADLANYARYLYIRLRVLEEFLNARGIDFPTGTVEEVWGDDPLSSGPSSFIPAEKIQGFLSSKERTGGLHNS